MTKIHLLGASIAAAMTAVAAPANAAVILFELTGSRTATFAFDPTITPPDFQASSSLIGEQASFNTITGTFGGVAGTAFVGFGNGLAADLNIQSPNLGFTQFTSSDFFRLVNSRAQFTLGTFELNSIVSGRSTLTISELAVGAVPEPATWAMLILGFGMIGGAIRYRRRAPTVSFASTGR